MPASDDEILSLRPEGFALDRSAIEAYLSSLPGTLHMPDSGYFTLVVPAADSPRVQANLASPSAMVWQPGSPEWVSLDVNDERIWIHPGLGPKAWSRTQTVIRSLLGLGAWRVSGVTPGCERELGTIRSLEELYRAEYYDPDVPALDKNHPAESPPRVGQLTTFRRYLGDVEENHYFHVFVRVHDSGAFSCDITSEEDDLHWVGRLEPEFAERWTAIVAQLDFNERSPGWEGDFRDRVALIVERPGEERANTLDAEHPPPSFAGIVRLMDGWAHDLLDGKVPAQLRDLHAVSPPGSSA